MSLWGTVYRGDLITFILANSLNIEFRKIKKPDNTIYDVEIYKVLRFIRGRLGI